MSLRWRILIFSAGGILVILALLGYFGISAARESTKQTLNERLLLAEQVAHGVDFNIQQAFHEISVISGRVFERINEGDPDLTSLLTDVKQLLPFDASYIYLVDNQKNILIAEPPAATTSNLDILRSAYIESVFRSNEATVSSMVFDDYLKDYVVYFVAPLKDSEGRSSMVISLAIEISETSLSDFINIGGVGKTGYVELVDSNGFVIASSKPENFLKASDHGGVFADLIRTHSTSVSTCHSCHTTPENENKAREIITFAPLSSAPWGVVVRQPEAEALANASLLNQRLLIFGLVSLCAVLPVIWFSTKNITDHINKITVASQKIAQGSLDENVAVQGKDEISVLSQSFDKMRTRLKDSIEKLRDRTDELEGLNAIAVDVSQSLDLDTILTSALAKVLEITKMEAGAILVRDEKTQALSYKASKGLRLESTKNDNDIGFDQSIEEKVAKTGEPVIISDKFIEELSGSPESLDQRMHAFVCFPLRSKDNVIGVITLTSRSPRDFSASNKQLLTSIASQISMAVENAKLYEDLVEKEQILSELLKHSISAQEDERKRIARELHDETSQALTTLAIGLETIAKSPPGDQDRLKFALKKNQDLTIRILDDIHRLILDLRPSVLDDMGLIPALEWYANNRFESEGIKVHIETCGVEQRLPSYIEVALFRIAQEALSNIAQHARAEIASITIDFQTDHVKLTIEDDGIGFESKDALVRHDDKPGFGLLGMAERADALKGKITVQSKPGLGTQVEIEIPVNWNNDEGSKK